MRDAQEVGNGLLLRDGHIADAQRLGVRIGAVDGLRDHGLGVAVIEDPGVWADLLRLAHDLQDRRDAAQREGESAKAAGLLAQDAVAQRDLLVLLALLVAARADLDEQKVRAAERRLDLGRIRDLHALRVLPGV